jgi:AAA15 family ATPase/GTPase
MENNCRILNRIVQINIANVKYTDLELSGNTCFVGTNNFGKTSLQRAILFFYSANTRGLGISASQKPFEEHYFKYENSYLIYEIQFCFKCIQAYSEKQDSSICFFDCRCDTAVNLLLLYYSRGMEVFP